MLSVVRNCPSVVTTPTIAEDHQDTDAGRGCAPRRAGPGPRTVGRVPAVAAASSMRACSSTGGTSTPAPPDGATVDVRPAGGWASGGVSASVGSVAHATAPSITRSRTPSTRRARLRRRCGRRGPHASRAPGRTARAPRGSRWTPAARRLRSRPVGGSAGTSRPGRRRPRRGSARPGAAAGSRAPATGPGPPSAGCRRTASRIDPAGSAGRTSSCSADPRGLGQLAAPVDEAGPAEAAQAGHGHVAVDRLVQQQALALALLRRQPEAGPDGGGRPSPAAAVLPLTRDPAGVRLARAVHGLERSRTATRTDQPGEADDLPGADGEGDVGELARCGSAPRPAAPRPRRPASPSQRGKAYSTLRPDIRRTTSEVGRGRAGSPTATVRPSFSTVTRSPMSRISSSRWEM